MTPDPLAGIDLEPLADGHLADGHLDAVFALHPDARIRGVADGDSRNLRYRFHPDFPGRGLARDLPVVARVLDTNPTSIRLAERVGPMLAWHGGIPGYDSAALSRRILADRPLDDEQVRRLISLG